MKKTSSMLYLVKRHLEYQARAIVQETPKMMSTTKTLSTSTGKILVVEQKIVKSYELQVSTKFQITS